MSSRAWLVYAMTTTLLWGVWGALIEIPEKAGFPATLGYSAWALTMVPVAIIALKLIRWQLERDRRSAAIGLSAGLLGCGGQLLLFQILRIGPAYIVFPIISLYPVVTIILSVMVLRERASRRSWIGIILALFAILMLAYQSPEDSPVQGYLWLLLAITVFLMWGVQAFIMKFAGDSMHAESFAFYTMASALLLTPIALIMTDFSQTINWGFSGVYSALIIQSLNAVGFLFFAYSIRYGKAIIVVPMMALAPVVTVILSLILYAVIPHPIIMGGMIIAFIAIYLMAE
ncbi:MAG: DMT family transporter [Fidelibacterota bacterium]|nr:MAG: DMT family transporter [Candidatus Neomarinimicrobiota bacterium]